jgi:hypothetical protein
MEDPQQTEQQTQQQSQDWKTGLPEDIRAHPVFEKYSTDGGMANMPVGIAKALAEAQKLIGKDKLPLPANEEDKEAWAEVWKRLGRPDKAEGYQLTRPKDLPAEFNAETLDQMEKGFKEQAYQLGILPKQAQGILDWFLKTNADMLQETNTAGQQFRQNSEAELKKEWGKAYDQNVSRAQDACVLFTGKMGPDGEKFATMLEDTGLGDHPLMVKFFSVLGEAIGEDTLQGKPSGLIATPEQAERELQKIYGDTNHPYFKKEHPEHAWAVNRVQELTQMKFPQKGE